MCFAGLKVAPMRELLTRFAAAPSERMNFVQPLIGASITFNVNAVARKPFGNNTSMGVLEAATAS